MILQVWSLAPNMIEYHHARSFSIATRLRLPFSSTAFSALTTSSFRSRFKSSSCMSSTSKLARLSEDHLMIFDLESSVSVKSFETKNSLSKLDVVKRETRGESLCDCDEVQSEVWISRYDVSLEIDEALSKSWNIFRVFDEMFDDAEAEQNEWLSTIPFCKSNSADSFSFMIVKEIETLLNIVNVCSIIEI